jgi:hypothetical protein
MMVSFQNGYFMLRVDDDARGDDCLYNWKNEIQNIRSILLSSSSSSSTSIYPKLGSIVLCV